MDPADNKNNNRDTKSTPHSERENKVLNFWNDKTLFQESVFKQSLNKQAPKGEYTFYDGPPFGTGLPHYGHFVPNTIKDIIPRFKTMQGYRVRRSWGWDCHGLPVENLIEKELGLKSKKDIVDYGIDRFNKASKESVLRYANEWKNIIPRLGRWVDMEDDYKTMDTSYTETIWWIFKRLYDKGLIYEGFKSMNLCPHCETTLSNFEVAQGYKDITDISVYVKFKIKTGRFASSKGNDSYIVAWTTTPWTLPGNVALAVNPDFEYVRLRINNDLYSRQSIIIAKSRLSVLKEQKFDILETFKGNELIGSEYEPIFDFYSKDTNLAKKENAWKIYGADFVTADDGTGVVHIAPAFGSDDYNLLKQYNLPFIQHVSYDGRFKKELGELAGISVKPKSTPEDKEAHQKTDVEILKRLAHQGSLFSKEKIIHSYPHCWRCESPLINYATSSWFVNVPKIKDKLVKENKKITWIPEDVGSGRFGNWLEGARDWAISRSRFWGAPIPVWKEDRENGKYHIIGSIADLKKYSQAKNTYYVMRHGEAENNTLRVLSALATNKHRLTDNGKKQVEISAKKLAKELKDQKIDIIFASPFLRTQETANIVAKHIGYKISEIKTESKIGEWNTGIWNEKSIDDFVKEFKHDISRFNKKPQNGETYADVRKRIVSFVYDLETKYQGKNILIVTHEAPAFLLRTFTEGLDTNSVVESMNRSKDNHIFDNAEYVKLDFKPLPINEDCEIDLHRPYIDNLVLKTNQGVPLKRVPDVFDCWFESGAMPYGQWHYPFANKDKFNPVKKLCGLLNGAGYPADFIAEGLDQTRGWFYSMLVLGVALFGKSPYKKVIVNGLLLAEDGQKMSKSKKNYPDPMEIVNKYGADSLRYYLVSSPVVRAQDLCFSEKGVDEISKKIINRLLNVVSFYEMYAGDFDDNTARFVSENILDKWMIIRLNQTISEVTNALESGDIDKASRPFLDMIDDISTWYLRRSRERLKGDDIKDKHQALMTLYTVLNEIAKIMAPFMPFVAEDIYQRINKFNFNQSRSVHLEDWPKVFSKIDTSLIKDMQDVRNIVTKGLELRMKANINVRQPLSVLSVGKFNKPELFNLIKEEVNVKEIKITDIDEVSLDTTVTPVLQEEGVVRNLIRSIQEQRKVQKMNVFDNNVHVDIVANRSIVEIIEKNKKLIQNSTSVAVLNAIETDEVDLNQSSNIPGVKPIKVFKK
jgi:isoleucyl-tRNA synthetase